MGLHYGAEKSGASVIPASGGNTSYGTIMQDFGPTAMPAPILRPYLADGKDMG